MQKHLTAIGETLVSERRRVFSFYGAFDFLEICLQAVQKWDRTTNIFVIVIIANKTYLIKGQRYNQLHS